MTYSRSKLKKHNAMLKGAASLRRALPATRSLSRHNLWSFLDRYGKVIVKPVGGYGGDGVMQVTAEGYGRFTVHYGKKQQTLYGGVAVYEFIRRKIGNNRGLVQQRIPLARIDGKPFDLRIMLQKAKSSWKVTGKLAKVAGAGYIITNIRRSKGRVVPVTTAIRRSNIHGASTSQIQRKLDRISLKAAKALNRSFRSLRTIGLDVGLDSRGKVWIIESNFKPDLTLFLKLKDKSIYRRIRAMYRRK